MNREEWLANAVEGFRPWFAAQGHPLPTRVRVACGFPSKAARARKHRRVAECWDAKHSADGATEVLISPTADDPVEVLGYLAHELCHGAVGVHHGHKGPFIRLARAMDLEGRPTECGAGEKFRARIEAAGMLTDLGPYPHAHLSVGLGPEKKQSTRLLKVACPECGYPARITATWLTKSGAPVCPTHSTPMVRA